MMRPPTEAAPTLAHRGSSARLYRNAPTCYSDHLLQVEMTGSNISAVPAIIALGVLAAVLLR